jgi:hypothetical protein
MEDGLEGDRRLITILAADVVGYSIAPRSKRPLTSPMTTPGTGCRLMIRAIGD